MSQSNKDSSKNSKGQEFASVEHLDVHFLASQSTYEEMLKAAGFKLGWRVLDAGSGSGSFLPLMSGILGKDGSIDALDLAPENVEAISVKAESGAYACPIKPKVGNILSLPYEDNSFDALWCANVVQYLTSDELKQALNEFHRVLKPNGLLAVKEYALSCLKYFPAQPFLFSRMNQIFVEDGMLQMSNSIAIEGLPELIASCDYKIVSSKTFLIEWRQPLSESERAYHSGILSFTADYAQAHTKVSAEDKLEWAKIGDSKDQDNFLINHPNFYAREGAILVLATSSD